MTGCVEYEVQQAVNEFRKLLSEYELDENFVRLLLIKVRAIPQPQIKICLLDLIVEEHEKDIKLLHCQIQSYDFQDPNFFFSKTLFSKS